ncbi:MAG: hypothetical protein M1832_002055 [Thelocarpon impressellum]|nr:MAG: hypothetical protein M1832_002055 [Thelocarpon impressellum]
MAPAPCWATCATAAPVKADGRAKVDVAGLGVKVVDVAGLVPLVGAVGAPLVASLVVDKVIDVLVEFDEDVEVKVDARVELDKELEVEVVMDLIVVAVPEAVMVEPLKMDEPTEIPPVAPHET